MSPEMFIALHRQPTRTVRRYYRQTGWMAIVSVLAMLLVLLAVL